MKSLENLVPILVELKNNAKVHNLSDKEIDKVNQALKEIEKIKERIKTVERVERTVAITSGIAAIIETIITIFKNTS